MWVILNYFPNSPVQVYGLFTSATEARDYAERHGMTVGGNAYDVHQIFSVEDE